MTRSTPRLGRTAVALAAAALLAGGAQAFEIDTGNPDFRLRWDNTVKATAPWPARRSARPACRAPRSARRRGSASTTSTNDGNNNFTPRHRLEPPRPAERARRRLRQRRRAHQRRGLVRRGLQPRQPEHEHERERQRRATSSRTRRASSMGRKAELLDAFVFGKFELGDTPATVRLGRHTLLWGESLFFGANGIAGGQGAAGHREAAVGAELPVQGDRPARPASCRRRCSSRATSSLGAYVGYEWEKTRLMPVGATCRPAIPSARGAERINAGPTGVFVRRRRPRRQGQRPGRRAAALARRRDRHRPRLLRHPLPRHRRRATSTRRSAGAPPALHGAAATAGSTTRASRPTA